MSTDEGEVLQTSLNSLNLIINAYLLNSSTVIAQQALASLGSMTIRYDRFTLATIATWKASM